MSSTDGESSSSNSEASDDYQFVEYAAAMVGLVYETEEGPPQVAIVVPGPRGEGHYLALLPTTKVGVTSTGRGWDQVDARGRAIGPGSLLLGLMRGKNDDPAS